MPYLESYVVKTVRVTALENKIIETACAALNKQRAELMQEALGEEAHRLGIYVGLPDPAPLRHPWPYAPKRDEETTSSFRHSISLSRQYHDLLARAARHVGVPESRFLVGSTLVYVAHLKKGYGDNPQLRSLRLPPPYR